jgi:hypothetical protein
MVEVSPERWRILSAAAPCRFRRRRGMLALPEPVPGGAVNELRRHLNMRNEAYVLTVSWLLAALRGREPYPVLAIDGEQGTGKSTAARMLRCLVDPNIAPLRAMPKDTRDLAITANNSHAIVLDNLSGIPAEMSDALCRLSTGGGFATRALYTNSEEALFDGQRPIILNSIDDIATRSDLADRAVLPHLEMIPDAISAGLRLKSGKGSKHRPPVSSAGFSTRSRAGCGYSPRHGSTTCHLGQAPGVGHKSALCLVIVQAMGRALRTAKHKRSAFVLVPVIVREAVPYLRLDLGRKVLEIDRVGDALREIEIDNAALALAASMPCAEPGDDPWQSHPSSPCAPLSIVLCFGSANSTQSIVGTSTPARRDG